ncbi:diacylglycerol acyltransferase [Strigomonas culicis]|uniref:Diacylglycerol acyltransferase n=1 Tax=Strigomonas culicis TaxID=28005 RepID=S9UDI5_9TRYP|nr:diacylglycerol acyltransferase [Strigomonas culicis]|eukprot:EPY26988.1 diacylglycerol acyltransferase [Strigomonas culicis]
MLMVLLGWGTKRRFHMFQPFVGGKRFVLLQVCGYNLIVLTSVGKFILLGLLHYSFAYTKGSTFYGAFAVLGLFGLLGQLLLAGSIGYFMPPPPATQERTSSPDARRQSRAAVVRIDWRHIAATPNKEVAFITTCNATMLCTSALAEVYPPFQPVNVFALLFLTLTAVATVERIARAVVPRFHVYQPMLDAPALFVVQCMGALCVLLCGVGAATLFRCTVGETPAAWHLGCGLLGVGGVCLYLLEVRLVDIHVGEAEVRSGRTPPPAVADGTAGPTEATSTRSLLMPKLASAVCFFMAISLVLLLHVTNAMSADVQQPKAADEEERRKWVSKSLVVGGMTQLLVLLMLLMLSLPVFTHLQGSVAYGDRFEVFQPFGGNVEFILLQCVGWASYGGALLFATLAYNSSTTVRSLHLLMYAGTIILSQLCIHMSLHVFDASQYGRWMLSPRSARREAGSNSPPSRARSIEPTDASAESAFSPLAADAPYGGDSLPVTSTVLNNEMLLALVLGFVSISLRFVCDMLALYSPSARARSASDGPHRAPLVTQEALVTVASVLCFVAALVAQFSARERFVLFRTTPAAASSMGYVAIQTFGWLLYITLFSFWVAMWFSPSKLRLTDFIPSGAGHTMGFFSGLSCTCEGLLFLAPLVCTIISIFFQTELFLLRRENAATALAAAGQLQQLLTCKPTLSEEEKRRVDECLAAILGAQGLSLPTEGFDDAGKDQSNRTETQNRVLRSAARSNMSILCLATNFSFLGAALLSSSLPVHTLVLAWVGLAFLSLSCVFTHGVYGTALHGGTGCYRFFMPFMGGRKFIIYQTLGWMSFTICWCLVIVSMIERQGSPVLFVVLTCFSIVAEVALHASISYFEARELQYEKSFLCRNAEGVLTVVVLAATFFLARFYDMVKEGHVTDQPTALVPLALGSVTVCLSVPLGLLYLVRQAQQYGISPLTFFHDLDDEEDDNDFTRNTSRYEDFLYNSTVDNDSHLSPKHAASSSFPWLGGMSRSVSQMDVTSPTQPRGAPTTSSTHYMARVLAIAFAGSLMVALFVVSLLPFAGVFLAYAYAYQETFSVLVAVRASEGLLVLFFLLIVIPMLLVPVFRASHMLRHVHNALCCFFCYSIPTFTVLSGVSPPFFSSARGSWLFAVQMCSMSLLSLLPYVHLIAFVISCAAVGYFAQYHLYTCLVQQKEPFVWTTCVSDVCCAVFWAWYDRRYAGRPEITGRLYSKKASNFFRKYVFEGMVRYFALRIVVCEPYLLASEKEFLETQPREVEEAFMKKMKRVDRNEPTNQYILSFHPHGIFPGTSIYAPKTNLWERVLGCNDKTIVTTHGADVIFSVPLMREFPLCLGALSVSRRGIEYSLRAGNSPLIVTGGQSEMLLSQRCDTALHLVCHHLGFFRIALRHQIPLVPLLVFSESNIMDNVHCLAVQRWFLKRVAFPFPVVPLGRWHLPLPGNRPMMIAVGAPLFPMPGRDNPDDRGCLEEMRVRYFEHVERLFYTHRAAAGYPDMVLYIHNGVVEDGVAAVPPPELLAAEGIVKERMKTLKKGDEPKDLCKELLDLPDSCWFRDEPSAVRRALSASPRRKHEDAIANNEDKKAEKKKA